MNKYKLITALVVSTFTNALWASPSAESNFSYVTRLHISKAYKLSMQNGVISINGRALGRSESLLKFDDISQVLSANEPSSAWGNCFAGEYTLESTRKDHTVTEKGCLESDRFAMLQKAFEHLRKNPTPLRD